MIAPYIDKDVTLILSMLLRLMLKMDAIQHEQLEEIASIAKRIEKQLEKNGVLLPQVQKKEVKDVKVIISLPDINDFLKSFQKLKISSVLSKKLQDLFVHSCEKLRTWCVIELTKLQKALNWKDEEEDKFLQLTQISQAALQQQTINLHSRFLMCVEKKIQSFHKDTITESDNESSGDSFTAQKGHSPRAIAILEKVFAQTSNINRSEKLQLAKATKLEPRQVTIWFQNRRNRKSTAQVQSRNTLSKTPSSSIQQRKRKLDDTEDKAPQTPKQRRRLSESDVVSLTAQSSSRDETPLSTSTCDRSSSVDLFETSQVSIQSLGGTSCGTSYDDSFSSFQSEDSSPPRSTFGMNSFDDQIVRFTNAKKTGRSGDDKIEMMFNEDGDVVLDWDDLELNLEDFNDSFSQVATPNFTFPTNKRLDGTIVDISFPTTHQETNDVILSFARQLVEENFSAQQNLVQVQQNEGWQIPVFDKIFLAKEPEQDIISLTDLQSSQSSNPSGPSASNSTQTSPRSGTPKSLFNFDFEGLGLDDIMAYNNESIQQNIDSVELFAPGEMLNFDPATSEMLGLFFSPSPASSSTKTHLLAPPA